MTPDRRHALQLLAERPGGCTEALMLARGVTPKIIIELVEAGLATAQTEHMHAGRCAIDVARFRITDAGRRALAEGS